MLPAEELVLPRLLGERGSPGGSEGVVPPGVLVHGNRDEIEVPVPDSHWSRPAAAVGGTHQAAGAGAAEAPSPSRGQRTTGAIPVVVEAARSELAARGVNVVIAAIALLILAPLLVLIALAVKLTSPGPVFYVQTRVGMDRRRRSAGGAPLSYDRRGENVGGKPFRIVKFRSMRVDAEQGTGAVWARANDPRVTPVGGFLRKSRLDELPQLWNVLRGDMNIVGPRPERPSIFAQLRQHVPEYPLRQRARPGITGWAQINQAYDSDLESVKQKVRFDLEYLERQSLAEDLKIMARTLPVMLTRKGAC